VLAHAKVAARWQAGANVSVRYRRAARPPHDRTLSLTESSACAIDSQARHPCRTQMTTVFQHPVHGRPAPPYPQRKRAMERAMQRRYRMTLLAA